MRSSLFVVAAVATAVSAQGASPAPSSGVVATAGTLPLGAECAISEQCANGAACYASNSMLIKSCGKFNAPCDKDLQCATNTCQNGLCSGFLASSLWLQPTSVASSAIQTSTGTAATGGIQSAPSSTVVAAAGSLPLGAECASTEQCASGAECFASTAWLIKSCGKFNAACTNDSQCATNTCQGGLCIGFLASSAYLANSASKTMSTAVSSSTTAGALIPLGKSCTASSQCAAGAECTVSSAYQEAAAGMVCGPYNATCSSSSQCVYNSCFNSRCVGVQGYEYATSTAVISGKTTLVAASGSAVSTSKAAAPSSTAAAGSLIPLGKSCNATSQCSNGAECTVSSAWQEASAGMVCGPYNATCSSSSQCSYNSCFDGRCVGYQGYEYATSTAIISGKPTLVAVNGSAVSTSRTATSTVAAYTGAAGKAEAGIAAAVLAAVAFLL